MQRLMGAFVLVLALGCGDDEGSGDAGVPALDGGASHADAGDAGGDDPLDDALPFEVDRMPAGSAPAAGEVAEFTATITGLWKDVDYFGWLVRQSHGLHASYDPKMPDFSLLWQDYVSVKEGDTVTYRHRGGADNLMIRTGKVFVNAAAGYLASGEPRMRELLVGYSKGIVALLRGAAWGNQSPPVETIMVRALFTHNHEYELPLGRKVAVDYSPLRGIECSADAECPGDPSGCPPASDPSDGHEGGCCRGDVCTILNWNAHTVPNPDNPFYGDIWIRNMRSKDDVPHIFRVVPWLRRLADDAPDTEVRDAAQDALDHLEGFADDIVESGYQIRTVEDGKLYVPSEDLASFVRYDAVVPNGECNAKLITALVGRGEPLDNDCENGFPKAFEDIATTINYYNYAIVQYFHLTAITNAIAEGEFDAAHAMLDGLVERAELLAMDETTRETNPEWDADMAAFLLAAAASGLPLTEREAAEIRAQYLAAVPHYEAWPLWDLWDDSVADGEYPPEPPRRGVPVGDAGPETAPVYVEAEELAYLLEYCRSPWRAGAQVADCDVVLDPARWGSGSR